MSMGDLRACPYCSLQHLELCDGAWMMNGAEDSVEPELVGREYLG